MSHILPAGRALLLTCLLGVAASATAQTTYRVTFESTWSAATHPAGFPAGSFPTGAHYSALVGTSHSAAVAFWASGGLASPGIEAMAERGQNSLLVQEMAAAMAAARAGTVGPGLPTSPGSVSTEITVTDAHPLVTLVTMLAPSPDWFVGVHGLDLRVGGAWPATVTVPLAVYDAGTDSGAMYESADIDTQPREPVSLLGSAPFVAGAAVGTFTFTRLTTAAGDDSDAGAFALGAPAPNPARGGTQLALRLDRPQAVTVRVLDALGRTVATLADGPQAAGALALRLDTRALAAGVYTVVAEGETARATRRVSVVR